MYSRVSTSRQSPNTDLHTSTLEKAMIPNISHRRARHVRAHAALRRNGNKTLEPKLTPKF